MCLDLFAGTGAYGFEALSRGASSCDFVDISRGALELITRTTGELGCKEIVKVIRSDAVEFLRDTEPGHYDIIFADPPYDYGNYMELIRLVLKKNFEVFVLECSKQTLKDLSEFNRMKNLKVIDRNFGRTCLKIFISVNLC
jgi:16S rRNA (guanine966-N2)-methyltransferase